MRIFIALQFEEAFRQALLDVQSALKNCGIKGNYTKPENLHLTLAFIGEYGNPQNILDALDDIEFASFELSLNGIGRFETILWAGLSTSEQLNQNVKRIRRALAEQEIPFDRKKFMPHITLVRQYYLTKGTEFPEITIPHLSMEVTNFSVMRSERGKNGMIYTEIG